MKVRPAEQLDHDQLIQLIADFGVTMSRFRGSAPPPDLPAAERKLLGYQSPEYQVYVAEEEASLVGFIVCHTTSDTVSVEALFVMPDYRRQGVGGMLYDKAEEIALEVSDQPLSNWVHPNNDRYIAFLRNRGYLVLSLVELRKPRFGEGPLQQIKVGKNIFEYCC